MSAPPIIYYISAHGYGHGARSADILVALLRRTPEIPIIVTTDLPAAFFEARLPGASLQLRTEAFDVGMVQLDSIRVDVDATLDRVWTLHEDRGRRLSSETEFLQGAGAGLVVADIPAIPLAAAAQAGVPGVAVGNFSWDWIYTPFLDRDPRWASVIDAFAADYRRADLLLRLPFAGPMDPFGARKDIGLVASAGTSVRGDIAARTGADPGRTWVLLSFTTLDWSPDVVRRVVKCPDVEFFTVAPLAWPGSGIHTVSRRDVPFTNVLASCDIVVSKPGFGIVSECIVNEKPLVYVDRSDFLEYPILVEGIQSYLAHVHLPAEGLYRGELGGSLAAVMDKPPPPRTCPADGAETAATEILARWTGDTNT